MCISQSAKKKKYLEKIIRSSERLFHPHHYEVDESTRTNIEEEEEEEETTIFASCQALGMMSLPLQTQ